MQGNGNFFVPQLNFNIVNPLGVQIFANKTQINNICIWCVSASSIGECSACKSICNFLEARILNPAQLNQHIPTAILLEEARQQLRN